MILFDLPVYQFITSILKFSPNTITFMKLITTLGSSMVIVTGIVCIAFLFKDKKPFFIFLLSSFIGVILNSTIKNIVKRPRPTQTFLLTTETSYSFPSGHTFASTVFYGLIIYYCIKHLKSKKLKYLITCFLSLIIFLVAISRIYLGVHYATDVLGALILSIIYLILFIKIYKNLFKTDL